MSISRTAAMAKAYGMTYGEYCMRVEMGTLPPTPKYEVEQPMPEVRRTASGAIKWSKELTDYVMEKHTRGMKFEEISRKVSISPESIRSRVKYVKRSHGKHV